MSQVPHTPDYLVVGHLTIDLLPDDRAAPGGTAFYGAVTAQRLGYRAGMLTATPTPEIAPPEVAVCAVPSPTASTFAHRYTEGRREQLVHGIAAPIRLADLPEPWRAAPVVHLGPVIGEVDMELAFAFPRAVIGATPQGWMRTVDAPLPAPMHPASWRPSMELLRRLDLIVLSEEDLVGDQGAAAAFARHCRCVALTRGAAGITLYIAGEPRHLPAAPASPVDTNGAGDVFAAAMLLQLSETGDPLTSARFAAAAAALAVEARGAAGIPTRGAVFQRMRRPRVGGTQS